MWRPLAGGQAALADGDAVRLWHPAAAAGLLLQLVYMAGGTYD